MTTEKVVLLPRDAAARGRSVRIAPWIWDQVARRCREQEERPASYAWVQLGSAYALGLIDLPAPLPTEELDETKPQSKSLRIPDWVWDGVAERSGMDAGHWYNPWTLLGAAYARGQIDLPRTALTYPGE